LIDNSDRAAIASFGGALSLSNSALRCQAQDFLVQDFEGQLPSLDDAGGNLCGCPEASEACESTNANGVAPPQPVGGLE
jgi:hypothetical protein